MSRPRFLVDHDLNEHIVSGVLRREPALEWVRVRDVGMSERADNEIPLPASLTVLVVQALSGAAGGKKLVLVAEDEEVSPEKAAEFLHVSRPFLVKKLDAGEIPFHRVGSHRRMLMADLIEYKQKRRQRSLETLQQMRQEAEDMGEVRGRCDLSILRVLG